MNYNFQNLAQPSKNSIKEFKSNWKKIVKGSFCYFLKHPTKAHRVLLPRLAFAARKRSVSTAINTPEGFMLTNNSELLCYTATFIEQNLYYKPLIKSLKDQKAPLIVDIGFNCGFVSRWLTTFNSNTNIIGLEVVSEHIKRALELSKQVNLNAIIHNKAGWKRSNEVLEIFVGSSVSATKLGAIRDSFFVQTLAVDDLVLNTESVFILKIDTDGSNTHVLDGAKRSLSKVKWLLIEDEPGVLPWLEINLPNWKIKRLTHCDLVLKNPLYNWE